MLDNFLTSLGYMGMGMLGIIVVMGVIILSIVLINLFTSDKVKKSRKIIFTVALVVLLICISLFNGMRMKKETVLPEAAQQTQAE